MYTAGFWLAALTAALLAYLIGSFNFAIIVSRVYAGDDVRRHGSGNAGMTNILRTYGKLPAVLTAAGDFSKALVSVLIGRFIFTQAGIAHVDGGYIAGLFVLLGHLFPLYFRFKGGKGAMTTLGIIFVVNPVVFLVIVVIFVPLVFITGIVSLSSVLGAIAYPIFTWLYSFLLFQEFAAFETVCAAITGAIVILMHRGNIRRLLDGTEPSFRKKTKDGETPE